jgi:hypothetical protein
VRYYKGGYENCRKVILKREKIISEEMNRKDIYSASAADAAMIFSAPPEHSSRAQAFVVAPVVITSSTKRHLFPDRM